MDQQRWDRRYAGIEFESTLPASQFVAAELAGLPPGRALDLAAGHGRHTVWLAGAATALAPGGTLLVVGHDLANLTEGAGGPRYPEVLYTPETIAAELRGLRVLRADRVRRPVEHDGRPATAIDTLVRAERP